MEIHQQRKANLQRLIDEHYDGVIKKLCSKVGVSHNTIWRLVADTKHSRNIGEELARRIEEASGVPAGYLDFSPDAQNDALGSGMAQRILALPKRNRDAMLSMLEALESGNSGS